MSSDRYAHRKAQCTLHLTNEAGQALANTKVQLKQTKHKFLFGSGAFDFIPLVNEKEGLDQKKARDVADKWLDLYNYGTLPFYWGTYESEEGKPITTEMMKTAKYLTGQNVTLKGHPLCWHTVCADWLLKYDNATIMKKQLERIDREVSGFKGTIDMWDVINEVVIMPIFDKYDNALTRLCQEKGRVALVKEVFDEAKAMNPNSTLLLNDFNMSMDYANLIEGCLDAGTKMDVIGLQSHQHQGYWGAEKIAEVLARFEKFNKPMHFTENTIISGHLMPADIEDLNDYQIPEWPSTPEGEERQAKQWEEMIRMLFEHPLVEAVTGWDFVDGAWLGAPSGIVRRDGTPKPAYYRLKELIKGEWWTDVELTTDENGNVEADGFKGDYEILADGKKVSLVLDGSMKQANLTLK